VGAGVDPAVQTGETNTGELTEQQLSVPGAVP